MGQQWMRRIKKVTFNGLINLNRLNRPAAFRKLTIFSGLRLLKSSGKSATWYMEPIVDMGEHV